MMSCKNLGNKLEQACTDTQNWKPESSLGKEQYIVNVK